MSTLHDIISALNMKGYDGLAQRSRASRMDGMSIIKWRKILTKDGSILDESRAEFFGRYDVRGYVYILVDL